MDIYSIIAIIVMLGAVALAYLKRFSLTQLLIIGNLVVFMVEVIGSVNQMAQELGFKPIYLQTGDNLYTLFTGLFIHASFVHLIGNMLFLFLIGVPLEERVGKAKFAAIYFIAGFVGTLLESMVRWGSPLPIIGASGAIAGAIGGMFILYPRDRIPMFLGPILLPNVPVWAAALSFFAFQLYYVFVDVGSTVAYSAHLGGFVMGMLAGQLIPSRSKEEKLKTIRTEGLAELATTPQLKSALDRIDSESQPDVRKAWLEYFAHHVKCPKCGGKLHLKGSTLRSDCGYEVELK